ncbi:MAG: hypothetical protein HZB26_04635 [Candidatus Hydrogenedentes bacterium]|nr:hypothetical protein [Candidatus Hydrogenedentota bacterium]
MMTLEMEASFAGQLNQWDTLSSQEVIMVFAKKDAEGFVRTDVPECSGGHSYRDGFGSFDAFRTRGNTMGVCQFEGIENSARHGVGIRYKLVQASPSNSMDAVPRGSAETTAHPAETLP